MSELKPLLALTAAFLSSVVIAARDGRAIVTSNSASPVSGASMTAPAAQSPSAPPSPTPSPAPAAAQDSSSPIPNSTTLSDIQKLGGWNSCTSTCTNTSTAAYSMIQNVAAPSLGGSSTQLQLLPGSQPYSGALWFTYLGNLYSPTHFVLDLSFYIDNPSAAQALEFTVSQSSNGRRYNFSVQCDLGGTNVWRVWDPVSFAWADTPAPCMPPAPKTWNHLIWEFERDSAGNVVFDAVTVNGNRQAVNVSMPNTPDNETGLAASFQLDADYRATPYSMWLDNVSLTYW